MPHARPGLAEVPSTATSYGQVIEYIQGAPHRLFFGSPFAIGAHIANMHILPYTDRLYIASYSHPPDETTPFPYPGKVQRTPHKQRSSRKTPTTKTSPPLLPPCYFSIDRSLLYNAFHADFGPLHIGHLYRFALYLHEVLSHPDNEDRAIVFWSYADSRSASAGSLEQRHDSC